MQVSHEAAPGDENLPELQVSHTALAVVEKVPPAHCVQFLAPPVVFE